ncbi:MAG: DUF4175 domain-containing protein, partial [Flavobacteriales bacterium]|nr:DUF4175 domain-containing protein [Flavobacteriales bacterium]
QILIDKLDQFIRKYYKNRMIRGLMYGTSLLLVFFLAVTIPEYFGEFGTAGRTVLFWSFALAAGYIVVRFFAIPAFKLLRFGKIISHDQAARIIGKHFTDVEDKLLNTLQLKEMADDQGSSLVEAAIVQRIDELKPIPFTSAVDFGENRKYLKYVLPPLAVILVLLVAAPDVLSESTERLVRHTENIEKLAPYSITILNDDLSVAENKDFTLGVQLAGDVIPQKLYLVRDGQQFRMKKEPGSYIHTFRNVQKDTEFQLYGDGFYSEKFTLETLPTPLLLNFALSLDFPAYTGLKDEVIKNSGDITVPVGSKALWQFETRNTSTFEVEFADTTLNLSQTDGDRFQLSKTLMRNDEYSIKIQNEFISGEDAIEYQIRIIPDNYPLIAVSEEKDTLSNKHLYFTGDVKDDYGFKRLTFNYFKVNDDGSNAGDPVAIDLDIARQNVQQQFYYHWDLAEMGIQPGEQYSYYFEVWDNDGVHGAKAARTQVKTFNAPSIEELQEERDQQNDDIKDRMEDAIKEAQKIQKDLDELRKDLLQKEEMSWQERKKIEDLLKRQRELQKNVENIQNKNEQKNSKQEEIAPQNEELLKKQQMLDQLMEQVMSEEMKQMMDELERLMEELDMDEIQEQIEQMDMSTEDMEKELDRVLEQFKQLEFEQKMEEAVEELEKLAEEQEKLAEESKDKEADPEELKEKQDELNEKFEEWEKEMEDIEKLNEDLESPNPMPENEEESKEIKEDMKESSEQLEKQKKSKASESQQSAADEMKKMAKKMEMMQQQQSAEKMEEDMEALRALLENIITLSFDQELLMEQLKNTDGKDPLYVTHGQTQRKLKDDSKMVEDSLFALSKRIIQLQGPVNKEISMVRENMGNALDHLGERQTPQVTKHQQYVMTSFNNLALLLDEALKQMQQESSCKKPGTGNCEKPGGMGAKPSMSEMKKMQEALSKQLEQMKKEGKNEGKNNARDSKMSKELAKMAAKQAAIRQQVEKLSEKLNEDGSGSGNELKKIAKKMEEMEKDMVNKQINQETLKRQEDLLVRLLKAENAERQREMEEKRQSTEATDSPVSNPMKYSEYQKKKEQEIELLKTVPPSLKPYYRDKVNEYFNKLGR